MVDDWHETPPAAFARPKILGWPTHYAPKRQSGNSRRQPLTGQ
jgi:hypothetical protein